MAGKAPVLPLVTDHIRTLRSADSNRVQLRDILTQIAVPVVLASALTGAGLRLSDATQVIAGASILAGFSFGLAIFVFQLRLESARDPRIGKGSLLLGLLDELFTNVCYAILVGLALVSIAIMATSFTTSAAASRAATELVTRADGVLNSWWTAIIIAVALHYVVTLLMCLKRIRRAYDQLTI